MHQYQAGAFIMANERIPLLGGLDFEATAGANLRAVEVCKRGNNLPWVVTIDSCADAILYDDQKDNLMFNQILVRNPDLVQFDLSLHTPALIVVNPDSSAISVQDLASFAPVVVVLEPDSSSADETAKLYRQGAALVLDRTSDPRILNATVAEVLRRSLEDQARRPGEGENLEDSKKGAEESPIVEVGQLRMDTESVETTYGGEAVKLTAIEWDIVLLLARNKGKVIPAKSVVENVWNHPYDKYLDSSLRVLLHKIRSKMPGLIKTVRKHGYKIDSPKEV